MPRCVATTAAVVRAGLEQAALGVKVVPEVIKADLDAVPTHRSLKASVVLAAKVALEALVDLEVLPDRVALVAVKAVPEWVALVVAKVDLQV